MPVALYIFQHIPSDLVYAGKHEHREADRWPKRGEGWLPSGYRGSGRIWRAVLYRWADPAEYR